MKEVSVVGLGKLGACLATCLAFRGYEVLSHDKNPARVNLINNGQAPVVEPRLQELIDRVGPKLQATANPSEVIKNSHITFIVLPTPSTKRGDFSDRYLQDFFQASAPSLKQKKGYHLFVITSTVSPGTTTNHLIPLIERLSEKKINNDFGLCYNPEFIALGNVVNDMLKPDLVLIGESDKGAGDRLAKVYLQLCENSPPIARMSIAGAEIAKISLNAYVTMKISFANTLGNICERVPGADVDAITAALGADKRISPYYLKSGAAFGGPCFPRDSKAFSVFTKQLGLEAKLSEATERVNHGQVKNLLNKIEQAIKEVSNPSISLLGLAYKTKTPVVEESITLAIIRFLLKQHPRIKISVYDPLAMSTTREIFGDKINYAASMAECLSQSSLWVVVTTEPEFQTISRKHLKRKPTTIIDCWRILDQDKLGAGFKYHALGRNDPNN
ncbi:MAG: UDP-glucose/GDP-mannose dehydrogenase family protein [Candidatus Vogelbacteria bacterium]|nr:UDP-glucose/GDP-mannose dehydrogenase family protein [Candidatus Vogelbacteria bacterium]